MAWLSGWSKRIKITIDETNVDSDQDWFPVTIFLGDSVGQGPDDASAIFDEVGAESKKIAVTEDDGETELYVEIEEWDSVGETAVLHISKDGWTITAASATEIYIYYDSTHADNDTYVADIGARTEVWDGNFLVVQHMVDATLSTTSDSTSNDNDGTKTGDNQPIEASGKVGKAQSFDGINDLIALPTTLADGVSPFSVSFWFNPATTFDSSRESDDQLIQADGIDNPDIHLYLESDDGKFYYRSYQPTDNLLSTTTSWSDWNYITCIYDGDDKILYVNSSEEAKVTIADIVLNSTLNFRIAQGALGYFGGKIDEFRISNATRLVAWIKATYYSTKDDLLSFGSEETAGEVKIATSTVAITTSSSGSLTLGKIEIVTSTVTITSAIVSALTKGKIEVATATISISTSIQGEIYGTFVATATISVSTLTQASLGLGIVETVSSLIEVSSETLAALSALFTRTAIINISTHTLAELILLIERIKKPEGVWIKIDRPTDGAIRQERPSGISEKQKVPFG